MTDQDSTVRDIVIGLVSSILATILYQHGYRGFAYLRSERFRKARTQLIKHAVNMSVEVFRGLSVRQLRMGAYGLMSILIAMIFLSHGPKMAPDVVTTRKILPNEAVVEGRNHSDRLMVPTTHVTRVEMRPCTVDKSTPKPETSLKQAESSQIQIVKMVGNEEDSPVLGRIRKLSKPSTHTLESIPIRSSEDDIRRRPLDAEARWDKGKSASN